MSLSTPIPAVQALQLDDKGLSATSHRAELPDPESRKRRRITPTNFIPVSSVGPSQARDGIGSGKHIGASSAQPKPWDFLAKWEAEDSSIVEDIEGEEYYSDVSGGSPDALEDVDHENEGEEDVLPEVSAIRLGKVRPDRVVDIINGCIEKYAAAWKPGKGETKHKSEKCQGEVPVVYDANALWEQAHAAGEREELAEKYELEAEYYRQRLDKLCDEITKDPSDTEAAVKMRCRNLEVTVELLERAIWLEGIYKLSPETSSDDESQSNDIQGQDQTEPPDPQTTHRTQRPLFPSQVIDLGTPSASECSDDESVPSSDIPTAPFRLENSDKPGRSVEPRVLSSDPTLDSIETPAPAMITPTPKIARSRLLLGDAPEHASIASVSRWTWAQLEETQDRKRTVSRAIYEITSMDREIMRQRLQKVGRSNMVREIPACIDMLSRGDRRMPGILPQDLPKIVNFTRLFLCWWLCNNFLHKDPSTEELEELADCLRKRSSDPSTFCDYVDTVLSTTFSPEALSKPTQPSQAEIIEISDDDEPPAPVVARRKVNIDKPGSVHKSNPIVFN